ncbi:MAG: NAD-glutamate dehydrogenase [Rhodospirillales bacterium]|nr:NAD-glutamate dehydrogenase [Rhodospirillales bacterium]
MAGQGEQVKTGLIERLAGLVRSRVAAAEAERAERYLRQFLANAPASDLLKSEPDQLLGAALSLYGLAGQRDPGSARVRIVNPDPEAHGWSSRHTVLEVVNDDMPFLVDSVMGALQAKGVEVHLVIHPILSVNRDEAGRLLDLSGGLRESHMHLAIDREADAAVREALAAEILAVLADVRAAVRDWPAMREAAAQAAQALKDEAREFLDWLAANHFTFLGTRRYRLEGDMALLEADSGKGILADPGRKLFDVTGDLAGLSGDNGPVITRPDPLVVAKADLRSTVHRAVPLDTVGVKIYDGRAKATGLLVLAGLFTADAYTGSAMAIPFVKRKIARILAEAGCAPDSHDGRTLVHILETLPRDELIQGSVPALSEIALGILDLQGRRRAALFVRKDEFGRFLSCLVYIPRDRYDTPLRQRIQTILENAFGGPTIAYYTRVTDEPLARLQMIIRLKPGKPPVYDHAALEASLAQAARSWSDILAHSLMDTLGEAEGLALYRRLGRSFPLAYRERFPAPVAMADIKRLTAVLASGKPELSLYKPQDAQEAGVRFKIYHPEKMVALSDVLPMLEHLGFRVLSEVPYPITPANNAGPTVWLHDFGLDAGGADPLAVRERIEEAFAKVWSGALEDDGLNRLVLLAGLDWREVTVLRALAKYLRQAGIGFSLAYMERALAANPGIARDLARLFRARFDPKGAGDGAPIEAALAQALDQVTNADEDRILRRFLNLIESTRRTNFFQPAPDGSPKAYVSFKIDSRTVTDLPLPRPMAETWVYSPRVEAVHLRGGMVARGGIRWSDRPEDFRTEILGLMKAQMVKNAVIVPVGAKGGFVVKRPPKEGGREAFLAEGIECYRTLMRGLLDITDNLVAGAIVAPRDVKRLDGDDPYLVVAADKGTATFSDIANAISEDYGFWLGDAFASGGSKGYDHKGMGITARGAWVAVRRHFREMGHDTQSQDFTVVGVGDMSGDVFGNGMLRSEHIKLVAAMDHRHIFVDPDPDPQASFAERERLFKLPRSSWADYEAKRISKGGGIFERAAKAVKLSPEMKARFGIEADSLPPAELAKALLKAPVDLLWFGGIGTFVKARAQSNAEAGDRANDALRVDAEQLHCKVVGEGANLAMTQAARIAYGLKGGRINTDAIDNSAGVDTSDHEVNIKILLNAIVAQGDLTLKQRDQLLVEMTDEVAALVLRDNIMQTLAITLAEVQGVDLLDQQARLMRHLERLGRLDRAIEGLPDDEALAERQAAGKGLTRPEIAVLLAYGKIWLYDDILKSDLPDQPLLEGELMRYFPKALYERYPEAIRQHRLKRDIIATHVTNSMINRVGATFIAQVMEKTGMPPIAIARSYMIVRDSFGLRELWEEVMTDESIPAPTQTHMLLETNRLVERVTLWLLRQGETLDIGAQVASLAPGVADMAEALAGVLGEDVRRPVEERARKLTDQGAPKDLAWRVASLVILAAAPDIIAIGAEFKRAIAEVARLYFAVGARFGLGWLRRSAESATGGTHWQKLALASLIEEFHGLQRDLARLALAEGGTAEGALERWIEANKAAVERVDQLLAELKSHGQPDVAGLAFVSRQLRAGLGK